MELTISGNDKNLLKKVENLAKNLGLRISKTVSADRQERQTEIADEQKRAKGLYRLMEEMAASGAFKSIEDPMAWQREQRKDRPLPGRQEQ